MNGLLVDGGVELGFKDLLNALPDCIVIIDDERFICWANIELLTRLQCRLKDIVGKSCFEVLHDASSPPDFCPHEECAQNMIASKREIYEEKLGGYFMVSTSPLRCESFRGIIHCMRDINQIKEAERQLESERQDFLNILDSLDEVVYVSDMDTYEILYANKCTIKLLGEDVVGKKCHKLLQNKEEPCTFCTNSKIKVRSPYIWDFWNPILKRWYHCIDSTMTWHDGRLVRVEFAIDITARKAAEELRMHKKNVLDNLDELRNIFSNLKKVKNDGIIGSLERELEELRTKFKEVKINGVVAPLEGEGAKDDNKGNGGVET